MCDRTRRRRRVPGGGAPKSDGTKPRQVDFGEDVALKQFVEAIDLPIGALTNRNSFERSILGLGKLRIQRFLRFPNLLPPIEALNELFGRQRN